MRGIGIRGVGLTLPYAAVLGGPFAPTDIAGLDLWLDGNDNDTIFQQTAAQFTAANSESLSIADNASLSTGDIDFTFVFWTYLDSKGVNRDFVTKWLSTSDHREYLSVFANSIDRFQFVISSDGTGAGNSPVNANSFGSPSLNTWYFIAIWHDATANTVNIQINDGTIDSAAAPSGVNDDIADFALGGRDGATTTFHNGRIDAVGFWKRTLTTSEKTQLYNSGNGLSFTDLDAGLKTTLISWWDLNELSSTRVDSQGSNNLTDNNTVTAAGGRPQSIVVDNDPVKLWQDKSGNSNDVEQATVSKRPTYRTGQINSKPIVRFDGTDDLLVGSNFLSSSEGMVFVVYQLTAALQDSQDILTSDDEATAFVHRIVCRGFRTAAQPNLSVIQRNNDAQDRVRGNTALVAATPYLNMWSSNGTGYIFRVNGVTQANTVVQGADNGDWFGDTDNRDNVSIGAEKANVEATWLKGDIAEVLVYDTFLPDANRNLVETFLADNWGIILP